MNMPPRKKRPGGDAVRKAQMRRPLVRAGGRRCVQLWVPDTRSASFARMARAQARAVAASAKAEEDQAFIDAVSELVSELGGGADE